MKKNNKRWLALFLAAAMMVMSLSACSSGSEEDTSAAENTDAEETADAGETEEIVYDTIEISYASAYSETSAIGEGWTYFTDYITEASGGSITFSGYMSGTLGTSAEELDLMETGAIDMIALSASAYASEIPVAVCLQMVPMTAEEVVEYYDYVCFENEETAAIFQESADEHNFTFLGTCFAGGTSYFVSTVEISDFADMCTTKLGVQSEANYRDLGFSNLVLIDNSEIYENLRTGVCESTQQVVANIMTSQLYEVANYYLNTTLQSANHFFAINNDIYNSMSEETQELFLEAAKATEQYVIDQTNALEESMTETVEENGGIILSMTEEEIDSYYYTMWTLAADDIIKNLGASTGKTEQIKTFVAAINEYNDIEMDLSSY